METEAVQACLPPKGGPDPHSAVGAGSLRLRSAALKAGKVLSLNLTWLGHHSGRCRASVLAQGCILTAAVPTQLAPPPPPRRARPHRGTGYRLSSRASVSSFARVYSEH